MQHGGRDLLRRLAAEDSGIALVMALLVMTVLSIVTAGAIYYTQQSEHQSSYSSSGDASYRLAESGLSNALAVLGNPSNNATQQATLPSSEATGTTHAYASGTAKWWGVYNSTNSSWTVYGEGIVHNPTGTGSNITRTVSASVAVQASLTQPVNNQVWNYLYATRTGNTCDESLSNSVTLQISLYVQGNLCTNNSASLAPATAPPSPAPAVNLVVGGTYTSSNSSHIGASGSPINQAIVVGGCNGHNPCKWNGGGDPVYATSTGSTIPGGTTLTPPTADFDGWYSGASVGPKAPCTTTSGTPPVFENETTSPTRDNSVPTVFNLTPSASYTCRNANGEISWNATTSVLTLKGVIYIDGSVTSTASAASYTGSATLYLSGTFSLSNSAQLCGAVASGSCSFANWNPNSDMLIVCAANMGNQSSAINLANSAHFQGGLFAPTSSAISVSNSAEFEGPVIGGTLNLNNSVSGEPFPTITTVPLGAPGNPNTYAQPQAPSGYSG